MKTLLLTLDYELFGDGSGDVFKHIVEPTNTIIDEAERYGAKMTVFFERLARGNVLKPREVFI